MVLVDTREQRPWRFPAEVQTRTATLCTGDYSAEGVQHLIRIERKSLNDFLNSIGGGRARFERELLRMQQFRGRYLILEFTAHDLVAVAPTVSKMHPASIFGSLLAWSYRLQVQPLFAGNRAFAAAMARKLLQRAVEDEERRIEELGRVHR